ncbi:hypothetical protein SAMN05216237_0558 [Pseudomonas yamanorum]|nr:hypothetical protein SAMN05216237_0558 [Pseudomonas yamanorum]
MPAQARFTEHYRKTDRIMLALISLMTLFSLGLAFWHDTQLQALFVDGGTSVVLTLAYCVLGSTRLKDIQGQTTIKNAACPLLTPKPKHPALQPKAGRSLQHHFTSITSPYEKSAQSHPD